MRQNDPHTAMHCCGADQYFGENNPILSVWYTPPKRWVHRDAIGTKYSKKAVSVAHRN